MNIGVDATALYGTYGGVEYALWNLLCALGAVDEENHYTVYIPHDGPPPDHLTEFKSTWRWVRLPFTGGHKARRIFWQQAQLPRQLRRDGCDILHAPTYVSPLAASVPVVLTVYDLIALSHPEFATRLNRLHYGAMLPRCIARATRIIVPTEPVRQELIRRVPSAAERARVVPLGLEPIFLADHSAEAQREVRDRYE
ncbi:MAG: glycosyltransferase, partial [Armatimonadota bacterium]|nr:glycosyltransferase [Armatimonadota bacterium]